MTSLIGGLTVSSRGAGDRSSATISEFAAFEFDANLAASPVGCNELLGAFWLSATPSPHELLSGLTAEFSVHQIGDGWICQREAQPRVPSPVG